MTVPDKQLLKRYGLSTVLALALTYYLINNVSGALADTSTKAQVQGLDIKLDSHIGRMEALASERESQGDTTIRLLRLLCVSEAIQNRDRATQVECQR